MNVTQVSIRPTEAALAAGSQALTPELLAATGARYSRNNEGLEEILARIDPEHLDKSVDSIFRMIDYGHQSIADMAPVAMFMDGLSQWLAYTVWSLCQAAGGQESSTRYIKMTTEALLDAETLGIDSTQIDAWRVDMGACFDAYRKSLEAWEGLAAESPSLMRIPAELADDPSDKARKKVGRLVRNYGYDRARYYLPFAASTNMMMVMSARGWTQLCQHLCSHMVPEALALGHAIREQLALCAPRLMKHATEKPSMKAGLASAFERLQQEAEAGLPPPLCEGAVTTDLPPTARLEVYPPAGAAGADFAADLQHHDNRYAWIGESLRRSAVRFSWDAVALAEVRDLNRHRTGTRHCPLRPVGFYSALDQLPTEPAAAGDAAVVLRGLNEVGRAATSHAHARLAAGDPTFVYWLPMGAQCLFEHLTSADKFVYEAEIRTGTGAHYRYARHLHDALALWYARYPETQALILEGSAEPE